MTLWISCRDTCTSSASLTTVTICEHDVAGLANRVALITSTKRSLATDGRVQVHFNGVTRFDHLDIDAVLHFMIVAVLRRLQQALYKRRTAFRKSIPYIEPDFVGCYIFCWQDCTAPQSSLCGTHTPTQMQPFRKARRRHVLRGAGFPKEPCLTETYDTPTGATELHLVQLKMEPWIEGWKG